MRGLPLTRLEPAYAGDGALTGTPARQPLRSKRRDGGARRVVGGGGAALTLAGAGRTLVRTMSAHLSPAAAARLADTSRWSILRAIKAQELPAFRDNRGAWQIGADDLDAWRADRARTSAPSVRAHQAHTGAARAEAEAAALREEVAGIRAEAAGLRAEVAGLRDRLADTAADRDAWRRQAQDLAARRWWHAFLPPKA